MSHVTQQISDAWQVLLKTVPQFEGRVFPTGAVGWDQQSFPAAVVFIDTTTIDTERSPAGYPRMQTRVTKFVVEIHDLMTVGEDFAAHVTDLVVAVEVLAPALSSACAIEDAQLLSTTGIPELKRDATGVHAAQALTFAVTYHTIEGKPTAFADPNGD